MRRIGMIGLDLDGTFLDSGKNIPPANAAAVIEALRAGITVLPVTGRPFYAIPEEILTCAPFRYCIASGGAAVYDLRTGEKLIEELIPYPTAKGAVDALLARDFLINIFIDGRGYVNEAEYERAISYAPTPASRTYMRRFRVPVPDILALMKEGQGIEKLTAASPRDGSGELARADEVFAALKPYEDELAIMGNCEINVEIQGKRAQKGLVMLRLAEMLGIPAEETMAVGDSDNDLEMIRTVAFGVAMENANEEVRRAADYVTADNDHDGVAKVIREFAL